MTFDTNIDAVLDELTRAEHAIISLQATIRRLRSTIERQSAIIKRLDAATLTNRWRQRHRKDTPS